MPTGVYLTVYIRQILKPGAGARHCATLKGLETVICRTGRGTRIEEGGFLFMLTGWSQTLSDIRCAGGTILYIIITNTILFAVLVYITTILVTKLYNVQHAEVHVVPFQPMFNSDYPF
jgi:hypothetical protein